MLKDGECKCKSNIVSIDIYQVMFPLGKIMFNFTLYYVRKTPIVIALLRLIRDVAPRNSSSTASTWVKS